MERKFKLIKEYPASPKIGIIVEKHKSGHYQILPNYGMIASEEIENFPEFWEEIKVPEPLFVTEDGKEIFEGDEYYNVFIDQISDHLQWKVYGIDTSHIANGDADYNKTHCKYFSTDEAAEKYIEDNKPRFSKKQIEEALKVVGISTPDAWLFDAIKFKKNLGL